MREAHVTIAQLERALAELAGDLAYPPTPPMSSAVTSRLAAERSGRIRPPLPGLALWTRRRVVVAIALGLLAVLGIAAAARLAIGALEIRVVPTLAPSPSGSPLPDALGTAVSLEEAQARVPFDIRRPSDLDEPDVVRLFRSPFGDRAVLLAWTDAPLPPVEGTPWNLVLAQFPGDREYAYKQVASAAAVREVRVGDGRGFWVDGEHELLIETAGGEQRFLVRGNVLVWGSGDDLVLRMETGLSLPDAVALAETLT